MMNVHDHADFSEGRATTLSVRQHLTLSALWFSLNFVTAALVPIVLPVQIALFIAPGAIGSAPQAAALGWLSTFGAIISLIVPPVVGALSDRTRGPLGRRRPYVAIGALLLVFSATVLAAPRDVMVLLGGLVLYQLGSNVCTAGYQGIIPDLVPETRRGEASGYMGVMTILGSAASLGLAAVLLSQVVNSVTSHDLIRQGAGVYYLATGVVVVVGAGITLLGVHETPLIAAPAAAVAEWVGVRKWARRIGGLWMEPWHHRNYRWVFLTRCSVMLGLSLFMTFIEYYLANVSHVTNFVAETAALAVLALLGAALSAFTLGMMSDRINRVGLVCFASACMSLAAASFMFLPATFPLWPLGLLFGIGYGAYTSVDWALAVDVMPSADTVGKDMGIWTIATTLPAILAPVIGGVAISLASAFKATSAGYRAVFALAAAFLVAGAVFILRVRDTIPGPDAKPPKGPTAAGSSRRRVAGGWRLAFRTGSGRARGFLRFWPLWERITLFVHHADPIPSAPYDLLHVQFTTHKGQSITLPDDTVINKGDRIGEIHIHNRVMAQYAADVVSWKLLAMLANDLWALARWTDDPAFPAEVKAFYGFTLLSKGAARLGFTLRDRPHTLHTRLDRFFLTGLMVLYNPSGTGRLRSGTTYGSYPLEVWMSRGELVRRYRHRLTNTS